MRNGIASPTEVVAVMRFVSSESLANVERIKAQTELAKAQKEKTEAEAVKQEMFDKAIAAMSRYQGNNPRPSI